MSSLFRIYLLTSPSGKHYVGQTGQTFNQRLIKHKSTAKTFKKCKNKGIPTTGSGCVALYNAVSLYGWESFKKRVLITCKEIDVDRLEKMYICKYKSMAPNGYNLITGGNSNKHMSELTKKKMSESAVKRDSSIYRKSKETKKLPKYLLRYKKWI